MQVSSLKHRHFFTQTAQFPWTFLGALLLLIPVCLFTPAAHAQFNASLSGTVQDPSGGVVPGATVTLVNTATKEQKTATTGASGFYRFGELGPGHYGMTVNAKGFQQQSFPDVALAAETPRDLNVTLSLGQSSETVTVDASRALLPSGDATVSSTISTQEITQLPVFGGDPYELLRTSVGVTGDGARAGSGGAVSLPNNTSQNQSNYGIFQTENQIQISAAGQRVTSNTYAIDGVTVDSLLHGGAAIITPNTESVGQITVVTSNFDASLGWNVGAHTETVTKSGSNDIHGTMLFQYDEPGLNAFQPYGGPTVTAGVFAPPIKDENKQRLWAASLGGPIKKNKLFWFGSYEGAKSSSQSFSEQYVPTPQFYSGLAAARPNGLVASTLKNPAAQAVVRAILPGSCTAIQGGATTSSVCQPVGTGFDIGSFAGSEGTYLSSSNSTTPNQTVGNGLDGIPDLEFAQISTPAKYRGNQFNGRVDWFASEKNQIAGSFYTQKLDQTSLDPAAGAAPDTNLPFKPFNSSATVLYIHTFSGTLINEARANYTRFADNQVRDSAGLVNWGVPGLYAQNYGFGSMDFSIRSEADTPAIFAENTYEIRDMVTKTWGPHAIRMGGQFRIDQDNDNLSGLARPTYAFQGIWNMANDAPLYEGIAADPNTGGIGNASRAFRDHYIAAFVQDDWKIRPRLTLNLGMRWEYFEALYNKTFEINNLQLATTPGLQLINSRFIPVNHIWPTTPNAFAPKLGFAWLPFHDNSRVVIRGGFGVSFDRFDAEPFITSYENGPGYFSYGLCCAGTNTPPSVGTTGIVFGYGSSDSPFSYAPNPNLATGTNAITGTPNGLKMANGQIAPPPQIETYSGSPLTTQPTLYNFSLDNQFELPFQTVFGIGYQGSSGFHFLRLVDQNFLYSQSNGTCAAGGACTPGVNQSPFFAAYVPTSDVHTSYNALNAHVEKRMQHGVEFTAAYTWSKSMDNSSNEGPGSLSNQTNPAFPKTEYGPSDFDVRNRFTAAGVWTLPTPKGGLLVREGLGGWQINGVYTWHTGFPWTPTVGVPSVLLVNGAAQIQPTRPLGYKGGAGNSCANSAYIHGTNFPLGGPAYFTYAGNGLPSGATGQPGIGRNSWNGPCYLDTDMSFAKQVTMHVADHDALLRFQGNFYNIFNHTNLQPLSFGTNETNISQPVFGLAPLADNGRVIEFQLRAQF